MWAILLCPAQFTEPLHVAAKLRNHKKKINKQTDKKKHHLVKSNKYLYRTVALNGKNKSDMMQKVAVSNLGWDCRLLENSLCQPSSKRYLSLNKERIKQRKEWNKIGLSYAVPNTYSIQLASNI